MEGFFTCNPLTLERQVKLSDGGVTRHTPANEYILPGIFCLPLSFLSF
jgi:hypothetical protein